LDTKSLFTALFLLTCTLLYGVVETPVAKAQTSSQNRWFKNHRTFTKQYKSKRNHLERLQQVEQLLQALKSWLRQVQQRKVYSETQLKHILKILKYLKKKRSPPKQPKHSALRLYSRVLAHLEPFILTDGPTSKALDQATTQIMRLFGPFLSTNARKKARVFVLPLFQKLRKLEKDISNNDKNFEGNRQTIRQLKAHQMALSMRWRALKRQQKKKVRGQLKTVKKRLRSYQKLVKKHRKELAQLRKSSFRLLDKEQKRIKRWIRHLQRGMRGSGKRSLVAMPVKRLLTTLQDSLVLLDRYRLNLNTRWLFRTFEGVPYRHAYVNRQGKLRFDGRSRKRLRRECQRQGFTSLYSCKDKIAKGLNCITYGNILMNVAVGMRQYTPSVPGTAWYVFKKKEYAKSGLRPSPILFAYKRSKISQLTKVLRKLGTMFFIQIYFGEPPRREAVHTVFIYYEHFADRPRFLFSDAGSSPEIVYKKKPLEGLFAYDSPNATYDIFLLNTSKTRSLTSYERRHKRFYRKLIRSLQQAKTATYLTQNTQLFPKLSNE